ncbi:hypothetical protein D3C71_677650 [compost metagenome]
MHEIDRFCHQKRSLFNQIETFCDLSIHPLLKLPTISADKTGIVFTQFCTPKRTVI